MTSTSSQRVLANDQLWEYVQINRGCKGRSQNEQSSRVVQSCLGPRGSEKSATDGNKGVGG